MASAPVAGERSVPNTPPHALEALVERYDHEVIDIPGGHGRVRLRVDGVGDWDAILAAGHVRLRPASSGIEPDALLSADAATWERIAQDVRGGTEAFRRGRLKVRKNLHLGIGFLAATSGITAPGRLRFETVDTAAGRISTLSAGTGDPVLCLHGLGGTKASFMPTVRGLADRHRVIAADLPGFGESDKPIAAAYDAPYFAGAVDLGGAGTTRY